MSNISDITDEKKSKTFFDAATIITYFLIVSFLLPFILRKTNEKREIKLAINFRNSKPFLMTL